MNDAPSRAWSRLSVAAWVALAAHLAAGASTALILRPGLETNPDLAERLRYVAENQALWIGGWLVWNAAALSILYFFICFAAAHRDSDWTSLRAALLLCAAGIAPDLAAEAIEMGVLPGLTSRPDLFLALHRAAVMMTGYVANGLYSLATLLLVWTTRAGYPRWIVIAGYLVGGSGLFLSAAALADSVSGLVAAHFVLIPGLLLWQAGVAVTAARRARGSS